MFTLRAKPWEVTKREMWTPMAASLASGSLWRANSRSLRLAPDDASKRAVPRDDIAGFAAFSPDAGQAGDALGGDGEVGAGADQDFFEAADEFDHA